jgi:hypothetical protein
MVYVSGVTGVSFKIEKRRNRCPVISIKVQESLDFVFCMIFPGLSSFPHFERDPCDRSDVSNAP